MVFPSGQTKNICTDCGWFGFEADFWGELGKQSDEGSGFHRWGGVGGTGRSLSPAPTHAVLRDGGPSTNPTSGKGPREEFPGHMVVGESGRWARPHVSTY